MKVIGEARGGDDLVEIYSVRTDNLGLTRAWFDEHSGLAIGHIGKILGEGQSKRLGHDSISIINQCLALKFLVVIDERQVEYMHGKWEGRQRPNRVMPVRASIRAKQRFLPIIAREMQERGKCRISTGMMTKMSPAKRKALAKRAARARWSRRKAGRETRMESAKPTSSESSKY